MSSAKKSGWPKLGRRVPAVALVLSCLATEANATMVVALGNRNFMVIAADSRGNNEDGTKKDDLACKVAIDSQKDGQAIAVSGNQGVGLTLMATWRKLPPAPWLTRTQNFLSNPGRHSAPKTLTGDVLLIGFAASLPSLVRLKATANAPAGDFSFAPPDIRNSTPLVAALGGAGTDFGAVEGQIATLTTEDEYIALARGLINRQAIRDSTVGGPIDVAVLTPTSARWKEGMIKGHCR